MSISLIGALWRVWGWIKWPLMALLVLFIALCVYYLYVGSQVVKTREAVAKIHANHLVWDDVFGSLPPEPDPAADSATLAGIDANNNGIRDDVERAIYSAHKNSAKVAAAEFQYAKELQMEFTDVFNSDTLVAVLQEEDRGYQCIRSGGGQTEVENLIFNTQVRKDAREKIYSDYMRGFALPNSDYCDLDPASLPN